MKRRDFLKGLLTVPATGILLQILGKEAEADVEAKEPHIKSVGSVGTTFIWGGTALFESHRRMSDDDMARFANAIRKGKRRL